MAKILGLDYGAMRMGVAISDEEQKYAFSYCTLKVDKSEALFKQLKKICQDEGIGKIILGLPLNQHGQAGLAAKQVQEFSRQLKQRLKIPVMLEDERFSSALAHRLFREAGRKVKQTKAIIDQKSAQLILQSYLDKNHE